MLNWPDVADLRRPFARTIGVRRVVVEGKATVEAGTGSAPVLDGLLAERRRALPAETNAGERLSPAEAALTAVLSCPGERMRALPADELAEADEVDEAGAPAAMPGTAEAERATGMEPGSRSGVVPAPEDHAFSDMLRQAAREQDVPLATFTDLVSKCRTMVDLPLCLLHSLQGPASCAAHAKTFAIIFGQNSPKSYPFATSGNPFFDFGLLIEVTSDRAVSAVESVPRTLVLHLHRLSTQRR